MTTVMPYCIVVKHDWIFEGIYFLESLFNFVLKIQEVWNYDYKDFELQLRIRYNTQHTFFNDVLEFSCQK